MDKKIVAGKIKEILAEGGTKDKSMTIALNMIREKASKQNNKPRLLTAKQQFKKERFFLSK